jgi:two-component system chemotaxis sensor kinase CheA
MSTGVRFRPEIVPTLRDVFTHLFRNGVDHGIESASERLDGGKPAAGEIVITARPTEDGCEILVRDDGRGLAIGKLRRLAARDGIPVENDEQVAELVFRAGVSTAEMLTDTSGRGVGMDAVRRFIREQGGEVQLEMTDEGNSEYTPFITRITLPRKHTATVSYTANSANSNGVDTVGPYCSLRPSRPAGSRVTVG